MPRNPSRLPPLIERLKAWRVSKGFSQTKASRVLADVGLPVAVRTLQQWEIGQHAPHPVTAAALEKFLSEQQKQATVPTKTIVAPVIDRLKRWRKENNFSTTQAAAVLTENGLPVKVNTLQRWESGLRHPSALSANAITNFLDKAHVTSKQQRLYWRLKELHQELATDQLRVAEKSERDVVQILDELMRVVEGLLEIAPPAPKNERHGWQS
jgi:transcriptional regulator with XRE-family HTH domain